jgi:hypothetical protein
MVSAIRIPNRDASPDCLKLAVSHPCVAYRLKISSGEMLSDRRVPNAQFPTDDRVLLYKLYGTCTECITEYSLRVCCDGGDNTRNRFARPDNDRLPAPAFQLQEQQPPASGIQASLLVPGLIERSPTHPQIISLSPDNRVRCTVLQQAFQCNFLGSS